VHWANTFGADLSGVPSLVGSFGWPIGMPERTVFGSNFWCKELAPARPAQQPEQTSPKEYQGARLGYRSFHIACDVAVVAGGGVTGVSEKTGTIRLRTVSLPG